MTEPASNGSNAVHKSSACMLLSAVARKSGIAAVFNFSDEEQEFVPDLDRGGRDKEDL